MEELLRQLRSNRDVHVYAPSGPPNLPEELELPEDVRMFYENAGGAYLFPSAEFPLEIVPPEQFVRANPVIAGEEGRNDRSFNWFIIAREGSQYITIDLNPDRLGRCYDSFWDCHAIRGSCPVVANDFAEFLDFYLVSEGRYLFWVMQEFETLGDAYD